MSEFLKKHTVPLTTNRVKSTELIGIGQLPFDAEFRSVVFFYCYGLA